MQTSEMNDNHICNVMMTVFAERAENTAPEHIDTLFAIAMPFQCIL